ncbi:ERI2, partial [Cervus elaphus hippelaphus]
QLGLIRRKSIPPANGNLGRSKSKQLFDYLIVLDFESTCWNDGKHHRSQEIIEFPAVLLNTSTGEIESEFHAYVQPQEHPILSEFCMELTGIRQAQVDEGVPLKICLSQFCKWIQKIQQQKKIIFATTVSDISTAEVKLCAFVTWSGLDDSRNTALLAWKMIRDGCLMKITRSLNKVSTKRNPNIFTRNLNTDQVKETSACTNNTQDPSIYGREPKNSIKSYKKIQMKSVGVNSPIKDQLQQKDSIKAGLCNVRSCSSLFNATKSWTSLGQLQSSSWNTPMQKQINQHLAFNINSKTSTVDSELVPVSTTISSFNDVSDMEVSSALDCLPMLADWEDVALLPASQPEQNIYCIPPISDSNVDTSLNSGERVMVLEESEMLSHKNFGGTEETPQKSVTSKSIVFKSPHTTIYNIKEAKDPGSDTFGFKLPECKSSNLNSVNSNVSHPLVLGKHPLCLDDSNRNPSSPPLFPPAKKQTFTIHEEKPASSNDSPGAISSWKILPSVLTSTVNLQEPWKSGKITPPLCKCGRRSKRLTVSNNGPNHGKVFYCCPVGKYQEKRKCCGYFKWEQTLQKERANSIVLSHSPGGLTFSSLETNLICDRNVNFSTKNSLRLRPSMRN